jgi:phosphoribulokinase
LKEILKEYYQHLVVYPHTMITRFFGLHKIKYAKKTGNHRIYFVIMANVFKTSREINVRYDLKGSTQGRKTKKEKDEIIDSAVALKDLDFLEQNMKINIDPLVKDALVHQIKADVRLF